MRHLLISLFVATLALNNVSGRETAVNNDVPDALASAVTIYRDTYGTPHVFGKTDTRTFFGLAYAQAEDSFAQVEQDFVACHRARSRNLWLGVDRRGSPKSSS